jgi:predicted ATP-dependent endonuclease of OLD family
MLIGLFLKHIKAYKGINFIPIGDQYNFVSYIGENGVGKSTILEALDSYFNCRPYLINKGALADGITTRGNEPFIAPIFLIEKTKVSKNKKEFERISNIFWNIAKKDLTPAVKGSMKEFFEIREAVEKNPAYTKESHFFFLVGENNLAGTPKISFASFQAEEAFISLFTGERLDPPNKNDAEERKTLISVVRDSVNKELDKQDWKFFLSTLKSLYSYVYLPVEIEIESFTKLETNEMQKVFDKKLKTEIEKALKSVNFDKAGGINKSLDKFIAEIELILNDEYRYDTGLKRNNNVTKSDLVNKILEVYFQKRILNKHSDGTLTRVSELSAGEKRQALINLLFAFLKRSDQRESMVIIGIDEPENSLHTALCYEQFEKLREISHSSQVLITTHWYGFLPIVGRGYGHFLNNQKEKITFDTYDLYDYRAQIKQKVIATQNRIPQDFVLKSTYDLVQSIFYSLKKESPYNWIICEGISEKIYFECFFKDEINNLNLRILPMAGQSNVIRLYKYLETPISEDRCSGKVFCLIDTDNQRCEAINDGSKHLKIRRLSNKNSSAPTKLLTLGDNDTYPTDIEQSLNPEYFQQTMLALAKNEDYRINSTQNAFGNTDFIKNFKNLNVENFFKENDGINKVLFAELYVMIMVCDPESPKKVPAWVNEIKAFFNH